MTAEIKKKWLGAAAVALLFAATLLLFTPAQLYLTNVFEFDYLFQKLLVWLLVVTGTCFVILTAIIALLPQKGSAHSRALAFFFALGVLLWLQGNLLVWNYGIFDGREIEWKKMVAFGVIDGLLWVAVLALALVKYKFVAKIARAGSMLLLAIQLLLTAFNWLQLPEMPSFKKYSFDRSNRFDFSARRNVIILLLDNFESDVFQEVIDENPAFKKAFSGFTYYRNNVGGFPTTYASVPLILTAQYFDNSEPIQTFLKKAYFSPSSIPKVLRQNGFRTDLFPGNTKILFMDPEIFSNLEKRETGVSRQDVAYLYDLSLFRSLPHFLKRAVYNNQTWFLKNLIPEGTAENRVAAKDALGKKGALRFFRKRDMSPDERQSRRAWQLAHSRKLFPPQSESVPDVKFIIQFLNQVQAATPGDVFKFFHLHGVHDPFRMDENFLPVELEPNRTSWKNLARGEIKLARFFLNGLKKQGIFNHSLIFVMADHGHPRGLYGRTLPPDLALRGSGEIPKELEGVLQSGIPLLLIKDIDAPQEGMRTSDAPVSLTDIAATIFDRLQISGNFPGKSIFHIRENEQRQRRFLYYSFTLDDWDNQFLPDLFEYEVNGHAWFASSWKATGRVFKTPR